MRRGLQAGAEGQFRSKQPPSKWDPGKICIAGGEGRDDGADGAQVRATGAFAIGVKVRHTWRARLDPFAEV